MAACHEWGGERAFAARGRGRGPALPPPGLTGAGRWCCGAGGRPPSKVRGGGHAAPAPAGEQATGELSRSLRANVVPEVINKTGYDGAKSDIWSCGVVLFVLVAGYLPFQGPNLMEMYRKIQHGDFRCPSWFSHKLKKPLYKIVDPNPSTRISIQKIKESTRASDIISKIEDVAKMLNLRVRKKDNGVVKIQGRKEGRNGVLQFDTEIFEITPFNHLVEMKQTSGDSLEYQKFFEQDIRLALKDIVWAWHEDDQQQMQE